MEFEEIQGLAKHHKQTFGRIAKSEMYRLEGGRLLSVTKLHDDYHDISLGILLSPEFRIEEIAGKMDRIPYPCCETKPLESLAALKGIGVLERGGMKRVRERIPRSVGCTHVYEMIESAFRAVFVGAYSLLHQDWEEVLDLCPEEHRQLGIHSPVFAGSCYAFNTETADADAFVRAQRKIEEAQGRKAAIDALKKGDGNHGV
jgi:hypothetical protein